MTTTDPTPLQESIARVISCSAEDIEEWDSLSVTQQGAYLDDAAAVLPIIRAAQADAWDEGSYAGYDDGKHDGDTPNPYRSKED